MMDDDGRFVNVMSGSYEKENDSNVQTSPVQNRSKRTNSDSLLKKILDLRLQQNIQRICLEKSLSKEISSIAENNDSSIDNPQNLSVLSEVDPNLGARPDVFNTSNDVVGRKPYDPSLYSPSRVETLAETVETEEDINERISTNLKLIPVSLSLLNPASSSGSKSHSQSPANENLMQAAAGEFLEAERNLSDSVKSPVKKFTFLKRRSGLGKYKMKFLKKKVEGIPSKNEEVGLDAGDRQSSSTPKHSGMQPPITRRLLFNCDQEDKDISPIHKNVSTKEKVELDAFQKIEEIAEHSRLSNHENTIQNLLERAHQIENSGIAINSPSRYVEQFNVCNAAGFDRDVRYPVDSKQKKAVKFSETGAHVLEYCVNDNRVKDLDRSAISEASDVINLSDLEALREGMYGELSAEYIPSPLVKSDNSVFSDGSLKSLKILPNDKENVNKGHSYLYKKKTGVNFPKISRPPLGESVLSNFSKVPMTNNIIEDQQGLAVLKETEEIQKDLETYKALIVTKVGQLESEIGLLRIEKDKQASITELLNREKDQFEKEKKRYEKEVSRDRRERDNYFYAEKKKLVKEKRSIEKNIPTDGCQMNDALQIINLKEEILLLKNEAERSNSLNTFNVNKLKGRNKQLCVEISELKKKVDHMSSVDSDNLKLKHEIDRLKLKIPNKKRVSIADSVDVLLINEDNSSDENNRAGSLYPSMKEILGTKNLTEHRSKSNEVKSLKSKQSAYKNILATSNNGSDVNETLSEDNWVYTLKSVSKQDVPNHDPLKGSSLQNTLDFQSVNKMLGKLASRDSAGNLSGQSFSSNLSQSEEMSPDGSRCITYSNGNKKIISADGSANTYHYFNGDVKEVSKDKQVYHYRSRGVVHTRYSQGEEEFFHEEDGRRDFRLNDGSWQISYRDGERRTIAPDGCQTQTRPDGTKMTVYPNGDTVWQFATGGNEVHTAFGLKWRTFPDGRVRSVKPDGTVHTSYPGGRSRVKDANGNLISDTDPD